MVEQAAQDYAKIIKSIDLEKEISPICTNIDDMLTRLDEFEAVLGSVRAETNSMIGNHVCGILSFSNHFNELRERVDKLEHFVNIVKDNLDEVESSVDIAEQELNVTDYSLRGLILKPLKAKLTAPDALGTEVKSNLIDGEFKAVPIFKSDDYFGKLETSSANNTS
ncbi:blos4 [Drosophila busckii]|uniref:Blos4 n=1 Tax=Drosophila busckii TaxID=30019 RepID=A0A0M4EL43_DROBS|nr:biogenesis of lysosome-related organelles complex 1 subunit 4 [Drosophila busckii]ALC44097.1 blos4 [Drosophila busckii]